MGGGGWRYILGEWEWVNIFYGWVGVAGGIFGWVGVGEHLLWVSGGGWG